VRARNIKPGFFLNEHLSSLPALTRLLFIGLWCMADREGRLEYRPDKIRAVIFPYEKIKNGGLTVMLRMLAEAKPDPFILIYQVTGKWYIQVCNFSEHQSPHHTEKKSKIPACVSSPLRHGEYPPDSLIPDSLIPDSLNPDSLIPDVGEGKPSRSAPPAPKISFNTSTGTFECITDQQTQLWASAYPLVDIPATIRRAAAWLAANPTRAKTNYARFLTNWFSRDQADAVGREAAFAVVDGLAGQKAVRKC
jgi:hypothetical protein